MAIDLMIRELETGFCERENTSYTHPTHFFNQLIFKLRTWDYKLGNKYSIFLKIRS